MNVDCGSWACTKQPTWFQSRTPQEHLCKSSPQVISHSYCKWSICSWFPYEGLWFSIALYGLAAGILEDQSTPHPPPPGWTSWGSAFASEQFILAASAQTGREEFRSFWVHGAKSGKMMGNWFLMKSNPVGLYIGLYRFEDEITECSQKSANNSMQTNARRRKEKKRWDPKRIDEHVV